MNVDEQRLERRRKVEDLTQQVIRAQIFFDLWWRLTGEPMEKHIEGMNLHPDFFRFARHGFLIAMVTQLMKPFDRRRDALSINSLLGSGHADRPSLAAAKVDIDRELKSRLPVVAKVKLLRDNCFAHRSMQSSYDEVFKAAAIRPSDIKDLIETALAVINRIRHEEGMDLADWASQPAASLDGLLGYLTMAAAQAD